MKTYQLLFASLFAILITCTGSAQDTLVRFNANIDLLKTGNNFFEIKDKYDQYYKTHDKGKGTGYKQFNRWVEQMRYLVDKNGNLPQPQTVEAGYKQFQQMKSAQTQQATNSGTARTLNNAQWQQIGSTNWKHGTQPAELGMGRFVSLAVSQDEQKIFTGVYGSGLWRTLDGGNTWLNIVPSYNGLHTVSSIDMDPTGTTIYVSFSDFEIIGLGTVIIKSTNGGNTWTETGFKNIANASGNKHIWKVMYSRTNPGRVYAATQGGLYVSTNGGGTTAADWTEVIPGPSITWDVEEKPGSSKIYCSVYVSPNNPSRFFASNDGLTNFTEVITNTPLLTGPAKIEVSALAPNALYINAEVRTSFYTRLFKSNDEGASFSLVSAYAPTQNSGAWGDMVVSDQDSTFFFLSLVNTCFVVDENDPITNVATTAVYNAFENEGPTIPNLYNHVDVADMAIVNGHIYTASDGLLCKSTSSKQDFLNGTQVWTDISKNMDIKMYYRIGTSRTDVQKYGGGSQDNDMNIHDNRSGTYDWRGRKYGPDPDYGDGSEVLIAPDNQRIYYAIQNGRFRRSDDGGYNFTFMGNSPLSFAGIAPLVLHPHNKDVLYAGLGYAAADAGIYKTTNGMNSWQKLPNTPAGNFYNLQICETNTNYLYASKDVGVFISTDGGNSWADRSVGLPGNNITSLTYDPANPDYVVVTLSGLTPGTKVYASSNLGQTWTNISYNLPNIPVYSSVMQFGTVGSNFLYVGTSNGVFVKDKNSTTWELWGTNTPDVAVRDMEITYNNSMLRIGTFGKGMLQIPVKTTVTEEIQQGMQGLAVTNIVNNAGTYSTTLSWMDYNEGEFNIELLRSTDGVNWTTRATLPANTITYTTAEFDPVTLCRKVYYKLLCIGNSISYSNVVEIDRDALLCKAPTALTVTVPSSDRFVLNWTDNNTNEAGYVIEVLKNNIVARQIEIPAFTGAGAVTYTILNQVNYNNFPGYEYDPKQEYCFRVRAKAINAVLGVSGNQVCGTLFPPPSMVALSAVNSTSISGSWVMPPGASGNDVLLNTSYTLYSVSNVASPFVFSSLTPNTSYSISIQAAQPGYLGSNYLTSNSVSSNTVTTPDEVPTSLTASNVGGQFPVTLNWNYAISSSTSGEGFIIERATNGVNYTLLAQLNNITSRTYQDNTGTQGQLTYYYRIKAIHSGANVSAWSNTAIVTNTLPNAPTGLSVTQGLGKIANLVWTGNNTTASYEIYRSGNGGTSFTNVGNSGTTASYSDNTVPLYGIAYQYKVRAVNNNGASAYSNTVSITLADNVPPASPTNLVVTAPQNSGILLNLSWTDNANDETGFSVERATASAGPFSVITTTAANATTYSNNTGLTQGTVYHYRVRAIKTVGANTYNSGYTLTANATAPGFLAPVNQVATPFSNTEIMITWQNLAAAATGVEIHRSTTSTGVYTLLATVSPTAITYTNTGLTANTTYFYKLRAVISSPAQQTAFTTAVSAKTHTLFTNPPSGLTAVKLASGTIKLDWVDNSTTENGFEVYQSINSSTGPFLLITTTAANISTYTNTGLTAGNTYYYKVRGIKKTGTVVTSVTAFSNVASLNLTARLATSGVYAEQRNENKISVSPNPASNKVQVNFTAENSGTVKLVLVNENGNTVYAVNWRLQKGANSTQIKIKAFSPGAYVVSVEEGKRKHYKTLIVQ
jgi:hypothetical protein